MTWRNVKWVTERTGWWDDARQRFVPDNRGPWYDEALMSYTRGGAIEKMLAYLVEVFPNLASSKTARELAAPIGVDREPPRPRSRRALLQAARRRGWRVVKVRIVPWK